MSRWHTNSARATPAAFISRTPCRTSGASPSSAGCSWRRSCEGITGPDCAAGAAPRYAAAAARFSASWPPRGVTMTCPRLRGNSRFGDPGFLDGPRAQFRQGSPGASQAGKVPSPQGYSALGPSLSFYAVRSHPSWASTPRWASAPVRLGCSLRTCEELFGADSGPRVRLVDRRQALLDNRGLQSLRLMTARNRMRRRPCGRFRESSWAPRGRDGGPKHSTGSQLTEVWEMDAGQYVEKVGLGGTDAMSGSLAARAKGAAGDDDDRRKGPRPRLWSRLTSCFQSRLWSHRKPSPRTVPHGPDLGDKGAFGELAGRRPLPWGALYVAAHSCGRPPRHSTYEGASRRGPGSSSPARRRHSMTSTSLYATPRMCVLPPLRTETRRPPSAPMWSTMTDGLMFPRCPRPRGDATAHGRISAALARTGAGAEARCGCQCSAIETPAVA